MVAPDHGTAEAGGHAGPGAGQPGRGAPGRRAIGAGVVPGRPDRGGAGTRAEPEPERGAPAARRFRPAGSLRREPPVVGSGTRPRRCLHPRAAHRVRQRGHPVAVAGGVTPAGGGDPHVARRYARAADSPAGDREPVPLQRRRDARADPGLGGAPPAAVRPSEPVRLAGLRFRRGAEPRGRDRVQSRARPARHPRRSGGRAQGAEPERDAVALTAEPGPDRGPSRGVAGAARRRRALPENLGQPAGRRRRVQPRAGAAVSDGLDPERLRPRGVGRAVRPHR